MRKKIAFIALLIGFVCFSTQFSSCKTKEGCGLEEAYAPKTDRSGNLSTKKGKSNLFDKKTRKRIGGNY